MTILYESGAQHPDIDLIQLGLSRAGYDAGAIDGIFGPATSEALDRFRGDRDLPRHPEITDGDMRALTPFFTGYVRRTVQEGDTMSSLARLFRTDPGAILTANPGVVPENLMIGETLTIPLGFAVVPTTIRFTSTVLAYTLRGLTARYPLIGHASIGNSVIGRDIPVLTFGRGENQVGYNASHHGNEWITTPVLLKFLENYARAQATGGQIGGLEAEALYQSSTLHLIPMVNPDGVDIATGALDRGVYYEYARFVGENYPDIPFPQGWKANIRGVDPNLQYPAGWEAAREVKFAQGYDMPGPRDYVGRTPLSEPESRAVYDYTLGQDFRLTLSYHSQGKVIYWKYLDYLPEGSREIAGVFSELSGYLAEETPSASGNAGYKDWFIQHYNRPGYTIEVGLGENPLPLAQFDEIYRDNEAMLATGCIITAS